MSRCIVVRRGPGPTVRQGDSTKRPRMCADGAAATSNMVDGKVCFRRRQSSPQRPTLAAQRRRTACSPPMRSGNGKGYRYDRHRRRKAVIRSEDVKDSLRVSFARLGDIPLHSADAAISHYSNSRTCDPLVTLARQRHAAPAISTAQKTKKPRNSAALETWKFGAGEGIRTLDPNLGKVVLYP